MRSRVLAGAALTTGLLLSGCGGIDNFDDHPGDIYAGRPATVVERWSTTRHTGKHGPSGYVLYLVTEDCEDGAKLSDGPKIDPDCESIKHRVDPETYLNSEDGSQLTWEGSPSPSEVIEHRRGTDYRYARVHDFGLLVRQCTTVPGTETQETCVEDMVDVHPDTWYEYGPGDVIVFEGDSSKVVSG